MNWCEIIQSDMATLTNRFPALRRFLNSGFKVEPRYCADNIVGMANDLQLLKFNLENGEVTNART